MDQSHLKYENYEDLSYQQIRPSPQHLQQFSRSNSDFEVRWDSGVDDLEETLSTDSVKLLLEELNKKHLLTSSTGSIPAFSAGNSPDSIKSFPGSASKGEVSDETAEDEEENADGIVTNIDEVNSDIMYCAPMQL